MNVQTGCGSRVHRKQQLLTDNVHVALNGAASNDCMHSTCHSSQPTVIWRHDLLELDFLFCVEASLRYLCITAAANTQAIGRCQELHRHEESWPCTRLHVDVRAKSRAIRPFYS